MINVPKKISFKNYWWIAVYSLYLKSVFCEYGCIWIYAGICVDTSECVDLYIIQVNIFHVLMFVFDMCEIVFL